MHKGGKNQMAQTSKKLLNMERHTQFTQRSIKVGIIYTSSWMAAVKVDKDTKTVEVMLHIPNNDP
jgi:hypothetical protein